MIEDTLFNTLDTLVFESKDDLILTIHRELDLLNKYVQRLLYDIQIVEFYPKSIKQFTDVLNSILYAKSYIESALLELKEK